MSILRCHLLIGPPASGKTSLSKILAPLLNAEVLSTDAIREELWGDEMIQGPWEEVENVLHQRLKSFVEKGQAVIIDATHSKRPWRLSLTQNIELKAKIEWIGWWFKTPKEVCLKWNQNRERIIDEEIITQYYAALENKIFHPCRAEGFATIIELDPSEGKDINERLKIELKKLPKRISAGRNKQPKELHGYSRLVDLERLLYLIQLLSKYPGLSASDKKTTKELESICNPLPHGSISEKASIFLNGLHQCACYSNKEAIEEDLTWLKSQDFLQANSSSEPIEPPKANESVKNNLGGWPPMADKDVFVRVMTLLRYILQNPFDGKKEKGKSLHDHYISRLPSVYMPGERDTFREDINKILTPYGFRNDNDNVRHGYGLGTAVLSPQRLKDLSHLLDQFVQKLGDPTALILQEELNERLKWASLNNEEPFLRVFANRSLSNPELLRKDSLAQPERAELLEQAIRNNRKITIEKFSASAEFKETRSNGFLDVWPLQLIFHNIGWYLAYEESGIGKKLIKTERLDRLALRNPNVETNSNRSKSDKINAINRLERLMEISGSIYLGNDVEQQYLLSEVNPPELKNYLITMRFRSTEKIYKFLREEPQRYPKNQIRMSKPMKGDKWVAPKNGPFVLDPSSNKSHPYPMEIDLPPWIISEQNIDFRKWLYSFGPEIIIEKPDSLVTEYLMRNQDITSLYKN